MADRKHSGGGRAEKPLRPAEAIAREFNEPGAGLPLEEAALLTDEQGRPVEAERSDAQETVEGPGVALPADWSRRSRGSPRTRAEQHVSKLGAGVVNEGPDAETVPGGPQRPREGETE